MAMLEFAPAGTYPLTDTLADLVASKFLRVASVGFRPIKRDYSKDKSRVGGIDFLENELLEASLCAQQLASLSQFACQVSVSSIVLPLRAGAIEGNVQTAS